MIDNIIFFSNINKENNPFWGYFHQRVKLDLRFSHLSVLLASCQGIKRIKYTKGKLINYLFNHLKLYVNFSNKMSHC